MGSKQTPVASRTRGAGLRPPVPLVGALRHGNTAFGKLATEAGAPAVLLGKVITTAVRAPRGYWGAVRDDAVRMIRKVFVPGALAQLGYGSLAGTFVAAVMADLGAANRGGTIFVSVTVRHISPVITAVVIAGIIGTATTAELGSRKIREEIDALRVLGQDPIRLLVLPRVIAMVIAMFVMDVLGILLWVAEGAFFTVTYANVSTASFLSAFMSALSTYEVTTNVVKAVLYGLIIAAVCASKGLATRWGSEGVGRAVNQAVVICVTAVFVIELVFSVVLLGLIPDFSAIR